MCGTIFTGQHHFCFIWENSDGKTGPSVYFPANPWIFVLVRVVRNQATLTMPQGSAFVSLPGKANEVEIFNRETSEKVGSPRYPLKWDENIDNGIESD